MKIQTSPLESWSGIPWRRDATVAVLPFKADWALATKAFDAPPLVKSQTLGPRSGRGASDWINLEQKAKFAYII